MNSRKMVLPTVGAVLLLLVSATVAAPRACPPDYVAQPPVILVSMDGFRASYRDRGLNPVLQQLADEGVSVPFMKPSYPTMTFPNHYTIVTGMYPESHGIIANSFYDPDFGTVFSLGSPTSVEGRWWWGEPLWNTLTRQGKKSATYFWPGSDADIGGQYPTYWFPYNGSIPFEERVDQVLEWVSMPEEDRPVWITAYFDEPDHTGHDMGPDSDEVNAQLVRMDGIVDLLVTGLTDLGLLDCVNLILVADHGMAGGDPSWIIKLEDYIPDIYDSAFTYTGAFTRIDPKDESDEVKYGMMKNLSCQRPDLRQYERAGLPTRFHFSNNRRIEDIVLDLDPGRRCSVSSTYYSMGNHGYDNYNAAMNAIFVARGPAFQVGLEGKPFQNIELYNLMCHLVGVEPAPNNGTMGSLNAFILNPAPVTDLPVEAHPPVASYPEGAVSDYLGVAGCSGDLTQEEPWLDSLSFTAEEQQATEALHLPWGMPHSGNLSADLTLLYQDDHVTGYSQRLRLPLWSSFTLTSVYEGSPQEPWSSDVRLNASTSAMCDDYTDFLAVEGNVVAPLFPPAYSWDSTLSRVPYLVSNGLPSTEQQQQRWQEFMGGLVANWIASYQLNLIVGPVFDNNADSIVDDFADIENSAVTVLPSDWFAIATRCDAGGDVTTCEETSLSSRSFIFPAVQVVENCLESDIYEIEFSSTVRDIETATGFTFYPSLSFEVRTELELGVHSDLSYSV